VLGRTAKTFSSFPSVRPPKRPRQASRGDLLIDTGNSSHYDQEISGFPFATWLKLKSLAGQLKPKVPLADLLRRIGEDPAKLRWAILSHVHLDHAGGLMDLRICPCCSHTKSCNCSRPERSGQGIRDYRAHPKVSARCRAHFAIRTGALRNF